MDVRVQPVLTWQNVTCAFSTWVSFFFITPYLQWSTWWELKRARLEVQSSKTVVKIENSSRKLQKWNKNQKQQKQQQQCDVIIVCQYV